MVYYLILVICIGYTNAGCSPIVIQSAYTDKNDCAMAGERAKEQLSWVNRWACIQR